MLKLAMPDEAFRKGEEVIHSASLACVSDNGGGPALVNGCFRGSIPANGNCEASEQRHGFQVSADRLGALHQRSLDVADGKHAGTPACADADQAKAINHRFSAEENHGTSGRREQDGNPACDEANEPHAKDEADTSAKEEGGKAAGDSRGISGAGSSKRKFKEVDAPTMTGSTASVAADSKGPDGPGPVKPEVKEEGKEDAKAAVTALAPPPGSPRVAAADSSAAAYEAKSIGTPVANGELAKSATVVAGASIMGGGAGPSVDAGGGSNERGAEAEGTFGVQKQPLMRLWGWHKKPRLVWSAELHEVFLVAISQVGLEHVVPTTILRAMQEMGVTGLTREQVSSHLQKYRQQVLSGDTSGRMPGTTGMPMEARGTSPAGGADRPVVVPGGEGGAATPGAAAESPAVCVGMAGIKIDAARKAQAFAAAKYVSTASSSVAAVAAGETPGVAAPPAVDAAAKVPAGMLPPGTMVPAGMLPPGVAPSPSMVPPGMYAPGMLGGPPVDWAALHSQAMLAPAPGMMPAMMGMGIGMGGYGPPVGPAPGGRLMSMNRWSPQGVVPGPPPGAWFNPQVLMGHPGFAVGPGGPFAAPSAYMGIYPPAWGDSRMALGPLDMAMMQGLVPVDGAGAPLAPAAGLPPGAVPPGSAAMVAGELRSLATEAVAASAAAAAASTAADAAGGRLLSAVLSAAGGEALGGRALAGEVPDGSPGERAPAGVGASSAEDKEGAVVASHGGGEGAKVAGCSSVVKREEGMGTGTGVAAGGC